MDNLSYTLLLIFIVLSELLLAFFVLRTIPIRSEIKGDWLVISFIFWRKKIIDIAGAKFQEVPEDVLKYMQKLYYQRFYSYSKRYKRRYSQEVFYLYYSGRGKIVCFESNGQKYVVDIIGV